MKRVVTALFLLAVVVGVSWVKTKWDSKQTRKRVDEETTVLEGKMRRLRGTVDSLQMVLTASREQLDSLEGSVRPEVFTAMLDSLNTIIDSQKAVLANLNDSLALVKKRLVTVRAKTKKKVGNLNHREALAFLKNKSRQFPHDLTAYERRVALQELKQETARRFSLSDTQVEKLLKEAGLSQ